MALGPAPVPICVKFWTKASVLGPGDGDLLRGSSHILVPTIVSGPWPLLRRTGKTYMLPIEFGCRLVRNSTPANKFFSRNTAPCFLCLSLELELGSCPLKSNCSRFCSLNWCSLSLPSLVEPIKNQLVKMQEYYMDCSLSLLKL